jgi:ABC-type cobalamin transport system permease subunit
MTIAVMVSSVNITPRLYLGMAVLQTGVFVRAAASKVQSVIILGICLPRVVLASIVGAALSISGAVIQALVKNSMVARIVVAPEEMPIGIIIGGAPSLFGCLDADDILLGMVIKDITSQKYGLFNAGQGILNNITFSIKIRIAIKSS